MLNDPSGASKGAGIFYCAFCYFIFVCHTENGTQSKIIPLTKLEINRSELYMKRPPFTKIFCKYELVKMHSFV